VRYESTTPIHHSTSSLISMGRKRIGKLALRSCLLTESASFNLWLVCGHMLSIVSRAGDFLAQGIAYRWLRNSRIPLALVPDSRTALENPPRSRTRTRAGFQVTHVRPSLNFIAAVQIFVLLLGLVWVSDHSTMRENL
jgi:hypothetical protein